MCRIIFHFFRFYYAEMRRKLWPKAPAREGALGQMSKNFHFYFIHIKFLKKPNKKKLHQSQRVIQRCYYICFKIFYCLLTKKNGNWKMTQGCRLAPMPHKLTFGYIKKKSKNFPGQNLDCCNWNSHIFGCKTWKTVGYKLTRTRGEYIDSPCAAVAV